MDSSVFVVFAVAVVVVLRIEVPGICLEVNASTVVDGSAVNAITNKSVRMATGIFDDDATRTSLQSRRVVVVGVFIL